MRSESLQEETPSPSTSAMLLPEDIAALLANVRQATPGEIAALEIAAEALRSDPKFQADYSTALAMEAKLRVLENPV